MTGLTLGKGLSAPMVPETDPSILPWKEDYRLEYALPDGRFSYANVMRCVGERPQPWSACCAVAGADMFKGWFATAEAARAAVEEHIAAHIETTEEA